MRSFRPCVESLENRCVPATITVTNLNDGISVPGVTLREAVEKANLTTASDTIVFKAGLKGTLTLTGGVIEINESLKINGPGATRITIDAAGNSGVFAIDDNDPGTFINATIRRLSLTGALDNSIRSEESLTLAGARVFASGVIQGSGGDLTLLNCTIHGNIGGFGGGVLFESPGTLTVTGCSFFDNRAFEAGGGLAVEGEGSAIISKSTFAENRADGSGGAISWSGIGELTLNTCSIIGNQATGGGGGLAIVGGSHQIRNSTIAYNTAGASGGGLQVGSNASLTLLNSTVSSNRTAINGGGFGIASGAVNLFNCTVAYNQADGNGGAIHSAAPIVNLISTIVARNSALNNSNDLNSETNPGNQFVIRNSLIEDANTTFADIDDDGSNVLGANPLLGPLQNNGGFTFSHALQAGSPALNVGSNPGNFTTDQRGAGFPRVKGPSIDIGAFER